MTTIYQVSELAGVSLSSVSRVMNNHQHVSENTKNKVLAAMEQLDYRPNETARSLASSCSNCIGILVSELHGPFYGDMLSGIESELRAVGKHSIIAAGHSDESSEIEAIRFLIDRNCDALILLVDAVSDDYLINLSKGSTPFALINRQIPELTENCFYLDNKLGGYLATKHLLDQGHREIAYISGPISKQDANERLIGHKNALTEFNLEFNNDLFFEGDFLTKSGQIGIKKLLEGKQKFTALSCANDEMASGAMRGARDFNLDIPADCSIMGFDNAFFTEYLYPQLSTIDYPIKNMAQMATHWILKNVYKKSNLTIENLFTPTLILRESTTSI
ncbi:MAG: LacI family DNA-binding transcriptional regulator [Colwellia sp.]|nr:LacI family DNA-binding transcriptional regulator [Colwellia sp.]